MKTFKDYLRTIQEDALEDNKIGPMALEKSGRVVQAVKDPKKAVNHFLIKRGLKSYHAFWKLEDEITEDDCRNYIEYNRDQNKKGTDSSVWSAQISKFEIHKNLAIESSYFGDKSRDKANQKGEGLHVSNIKELFDVIERNDDLKKVATTGSIDKPLTINPNHLETIKGSESSDQETRFKESMKK